MEELAGRSEDDQWRRLLEWASGYNGFECHVEWKPVPGAGRGLVVDSSGSKPDLLVIPPEMLINPLTLASSPDNIIPLHLFPVQRLDDGHPRKRRKTNRYVSSSTYSSILTGASEKRSETVDKVESKPLNTTQLLTLFLAVNRGSNAKRPSKWSRYLDTLPETFRPWHPLTWLVAETPSKDKAATASLAGETGVEDGDDKVETLSKLVALAPREPRRKILGVKARYDADLVVLREVLKVEEPFKSAYNERITDEDLLWAWLNVNTRSVSIPLGFDGPTELYNHSLVPVLDLINHSSDPDVCVPKPELDTISKSSGPKLRLRPTPWNPTPHLIPGKIGLKIHSRPGGMKIGEELRFQYHAQPTSEMWAEYGFIELPSTSGPSRSKRDAEEATLEPDIDNRDQKGSRKKRKVEGESGVVAEVVEAVGGAKSGQIRWNDLHHGSIDVEDVPLEMWEGVDHQTEKEDALKAINCHTNIRIESHPSPHPSRSLVMSLRVINLPQEQIGRLVGIAQGAIEYISPENEAAVEEDLERLCHRLVNQAEQAVAEIDALEEDCKCSAEEAFTATRLLWEEVYSLASDCRMSHRV